MKKMTVLVVLLIMTSIIVASCIGNEQTIKTRAGDVKESQGSGSGPDWCKTGTKITTSGQDQQGSFEIKGITTRDGKEVCQAEYTYDQGSVIQYFNEKSDYMVMIYKDKDGKVIQEINIANPK